LPGKTYLFLLPGLRSFFQLLPNPRAMCFGSLFEGQVGPCPLAARPAAGSWEVAGTHEERDTVPWLESKMAGRNCGVWQPAKAVGLKLHPGQWLQHQAGLPVATWPPLRWV